VYDRKHRFSDEDFTALLQAGYWPIAMPQAPGGLGLYLAQVDRERRRLA
jgi:hypothetical protein